MTVGLARRVIFEEHDSPFGRLAFAAAVLSSREHDEAVSLLDLVECLKRGNQLKKITAVDELAALALYRRTKRRRRSHVPYQDFITDAADWATYLKKRRLLLLHK
ncbi:MAG: hypothetical protein C5B50_29310 [Verrucomicrobia bacterium]|nr:MAG: hypothetical protein C5B50_29310 [Verrucomicrobiota bacterium]